MGRTAWNYITNENYTDHFHCWNPVYIDDYVDYLNGITIDGTLVQSIDNDDSSSLKINLNHNKILLLM